MNTLVFEKTILAPAADLYRAFTTPLGFQEWLVWQAAVMTYPGGPYHLVWANSYYANGEYKELVPNQKISFTWFGKGDPAPTLIEITLHQEGDKTKFKLAHQGIGIDPIWETPRKEIAHGWETSLENLVSVMETGRDLRQVNRPMLGIAGIEELDNVTAKRLGTSVKAGLIIGTPLAGYGAVQAGLLKEDVLVELAGVPMPNYAAFYAEMQKHRAGETISAVAYRGAEKLIFSITLSSSPVPEPPMTSARLTEEIKIQTEKNYLELEKCFEKVSDAEASRNPAPGEWSAREVLAHLIQNERDLHALVQCSLSDKIFEWSDNSPARIAATIAVYPTVAELLAELKRTEEETFVLLEYLPETFSQRKASFWGLSYTIMSFSTHTAGHIEQIQTALK